VLEAFPDHGFLGEEQVAPGIDAAIAALEEKLADDDVGGGWLWIVDPIDGTTNFASGIPINMPSIAVAYNGEVKVAVLYDPHRQELFTAVKDHGAYLNGERIQVGEQESLGEAVVGMESPAGQDSLEQCLKAIDPLMPKVRTIRMLGSSAVMLPWVANGRLTAYWTPDECAWDIAAGALILQEAGGRVTDIQGNDYTLRTRSLVGSNGRVHDALLDVLQNEAGL
jgi:myo-inositol-1(or 4)-monophosphatase